MQLKNNPLYRYKTDAVLTQTTAALASLHRATLMNWHHIQMIVGNMAGNAVRKPGLRSESAKNEEVPKYDFLI